MWNFGSHGEFLKNTNSSAPGAENLRAYDRYDTPLGAFAEMLLPSQTGDLDILPALPSTCASSKITGLRATENQEVDIEWQDHRLKKAVIRSYSGNNPIVVVMGESVNRITDPKSILKIMNDQRSK